MGSGEGDGAFEAFRDSGATGWAVASVPTIEPGGDGSGQPESRKMPPEAMERLLALIEEYGIGPLRERLVIKWRQLRPDASVPVYAYKGDAGCDLAVAETVTLGPGESRDIAVGLAAQLPDGWWGRITGRSSTLRKRGLFVNEGVIDNGYRGELFVYVTNRNAISVQVDAGDRLAQFILERVTQAEGVVVDRLDESDRGTAGFGSTGLRVPAAPERPMLYLGGGVDYSEDPHSWRHSELWGGFSVFCPICANSDDSGPDAVIANNLDALARSAYAVFDLRGYSIGTPIEAWAAVFEERYQCRVVLVHDGKAGLFVQSMQAAGAMVVQTLEAAARRITTAKQMSANNRPGG